MGINYGDRPTDGWVKVFRHNTAGGYFSTANNWSEAKLTNFNDPDANKFSILSKIDKMRGSDGKITFKLDYPNSGITNIWKQSSNPVTRTVAGVDGYEAISIDATSSFWGGLERNAYNTSSFLDGSVNHGNWFYAIASSVAWNGGIPGSSSPESLVELYVKIR